MDAVTRVLIDARALVSDRSRWTQGMFAADIRGRPTNLASESAVCFCSAGAIYKVSRDLPRIGDVDIKNYALIRLQKAAFKVIETNNPKYKPVTAQDAVYGVNDDLGHAEVLQMFDLAIAEAA